MPAELPYDQEVDREHAEAHRGAARLREERRVAIKNELRRGAGVMYGSRRPPGSAPPTQRVQLMLTVGEQQRIQRLADELHLTVPALLRAAALTLEKRLEGRL